MNGQAIAKIIVTAVIGLTIVSFATTTRDVTSNKSRLDTIEKSIHKMGQQISEIHWYFIRGKK